MRKPDKNSRELAIAGYIPAPSNYRSAPVISWIDSVYCLICNQVIYMAFILFGQAVGIGVLLSLLSHHQINNAFVAKETTK